MLPEAEQVLAVTSTLAVLEGLHHQITRREKAVTTRLKHTPAYEQLLTVEGLGEILAQPIVLETGNMGRFPSVGDSAAYCRCVRSTTLSTGKRKGQDNGNNGTPSLEWASREAAQCALRFTPRGQRFSQRKLAKSPRMLARKSVAHTLARACYDMMRALVPFEGNTAFGCG